MSGGGPYEEFHCTKKGNEGPLLTASSIEPLQGGDRHSCQPSRAADLDTALSVEVH